MTFQRPKKDNKKNKYRYAVYHPEGEELQSIYCVKLLTLMGCGDADRIAS